MSRNSTKISGHTLSLGHLRWPKLKIDKGSKKNLPRPFKRVVRPDVRRTRN